MNLTARQENFCRAVVLEQMNYSDAYRACYTAENMKDDAINVNASKVASVAKVSLRMKELKATIEEETIKEFTKSRTDILKEYELIKEEGDSKIKIDCLKEQGKLLGYYIEKKVETNIEDHEKWLKLMEEKNT